MKIDDPLTRVLRGLPAPTVEPGARERALHRATIALQLAASSGDPCAANAGTVGRSFPSNLALAAGLGAFVGLIAILGLMVRFSPGSSRADALSPQAERTMLKETETLFGSQLDAVIVREASAPEIRLAQDGQASAAGLSQPVVIKFVRHGETLYVLGYSGRNVCLMLAGRKVCFEPLVNGQGEVILAGENFCWAPGQPAAAVAGYRVDTRVMPPS
jgi:hypothetical protein